MKPVYMQRFEDLQAAARNGDGTASRLVENVRRRDELVRGWIDHGLQIVIVLLTAPGMFLAGGIGPEVKWGFVLLLASSPFWMVAHWRDRQLGMFLLSTFFMGLWIRAVFNNF